MKNLFKILKKWSPWLLALICMGILGNVIISINKIDKELEKREVRYD